MNKTSYWIFLILGTVIGAGYASGREIWLFFGPNSRLAIVIFSILFCICCYSILIISFQKQTTDYQPVFTILLGEKVSQFFDKLTFVYLILTTIIMVAGSGAVLEVYQSPRWLGIGLITVMLTWIFSYNINEILNINSIIVPILMLTLVTILIIFLKDESVVDESVMGSINIFKTITFTSVNLLPIISVIGAIGYKITSKKEVIMTSLISALCLGVVTWIYNDSLTVIEFEINRYEMPIYAILARFPPVTLIIMTIIIWLALFLTALAALIGIVSRVQTQFKKSQFRIAFLSIAILTPFSFIGFQDLVELIYPIYGVMNIYILTALIIYPIKDWMRNK